MDGSSSSHNAKCESQHFAAPSSSREANNGEHDNGMKGFGHAPSKRDSSPMKDSLDKKAKLSTEEPTVDRCQKPFSALSLTEVLCIEIFAGSARLTAAVRDAGMQGIAVDYDKTRSSGPHTLQCMI